MEYAVKAAYLYRFAPFVQWPPDAFASAASPFNLCVLGDDPFGAALDQAVRGQSVGDHPVVVRRLRAAEVATGCQILYVQDARRPALASALRGVRGAPVLTVSDQGRGDGTIIQFVVKEGHVRFSIDTGLAAASHVTISSKLLSLAVTTEGGR
ncbi:MAG TPA: YfiR family protein [Caulobacteraceae bacterium]